MVKNLVAVGLALLMVTGNIASAESTPSDVPSDEAKAYLDRAISLLREKHINSGKVDWNAITTQAHKQIVGAQKASEIYPVIQEILAVLNERHGWLFPRADSMQTPPSQSAKVPASSVTRPMPRGNIMPKHLGYVWLPELNTLGAEGLAIGDEYKRTLVSLLMNLDHRASCGWIIDLRDNSGGNMWPMLNGLDPLLGAAPFGYFAAKDGPVPWVRTTYGIVPGAADANSANPSFELRHANAPVAVLLGPKTSSTGEMIALAFIGRTRTKTFGAPTYGFTTANTVHQLSDGAFLVITESTARDRSGKDYSGPITPDAVVPVESAEKDASRWLKEQCKARN